MTPGQLKAIAEAAMAAAREMADREAEGLVINAIKDTSRTLESIFYEFFDCKTPELRDIVMSWLRKGREEYLKTGKITIK